MAHIEIYAPQNNVNDDSITVLALCVDNGQRVNADQTILVAETSKASFDIPSPTTGYVRWLVNVNDDVPNGKPLCLIADTIEELESCSSANVPSQQAGSETASSLNTAEIAPVIGIGAPETRHDRYVCVTDWLASNHDQIEQGQPLARIHVDGKVVDVLAPRPGFISFSANLPMTASPGKPFCYLCSSLPALKAFENSSSSSKRNVVEVPTRGDKPIQFACTPRSPIRMKTRFSAGARQLLDKYQLSQDQFAGSGLVRTEDILRTMSILPQGKNPLKPEQAEPKAAQEPADSEWVVGGVAIREERMSRLKRIEATVLAQSQREVAASQTSVLVPTQGIFEICRSDSHIFGQMASRIIFETARLLRKYPTLNAGYRPNTISYYKDVNIGYAMDIDKGLRVPVFFNADNKALDEIQTVKQQYITKYLEGTLSIDDLTGGTFTITDLSEQGAWTFNPIINQGQSAILGVGGEQAINDTKYYPLVLAFDHRISDGRTASLFLGDLRDRLIGHEQALLQEIDYKKIMSETVTCQSCLRTWEQLRELGRHLVLTVDANGRQRSVCTFCLEGW